MPKFPVVANEIDLSKVFFDKENPRHEPCTSQQQVFEYLCNNEQIIPMARDIVNHGLNPMDRIGLIHDDGSNKITKNSTFIVGEGHRRICALKLLIDPALAPPDVRAEFKKLSESWQPTPKIAAIVFSDKEGIRLWLNRMHNGQQGGVGRKSWTADQQHRFGGTDKNRAAMELLDYAEFEGFINAEQRKGKLTTIQRYVGNAICCEYMGLSKLNPDGLMRNKPKEDFNLITSYFIADLLNNTVNSRAKKDDIEHYARKLPKVDGLSGEIIDLEFIFDSDNHSKKKKKGTKKKPVKPKKPEENKCITYETNIADHLKHIGSTKLSQLYYCICTLELDDFTPLISVGVWSFIESLSALAGRVEPTNFVSFFSKTRVTAYGITDKNDNTATRAALTRISQKGNATKHHKIAADFDGKQLANDMDTLKKLIVACLHTIGPIREEE